MVYEPAEDSELLKRNISKYAKGRVLDMGTGSGILAEEAKKYADKVYAVDIDKEALNYCTNKIDGVKFVESDLFSYFEDKNIKFDTIIFNPPYLPKDRGIEDPALYGGKHGYEIIERFFEEVMDFIHDDTKILLLFSSFTKKEKVEEIIENKCLKYSEIDIEKLFFEKLFVYLVEKSELLKELEARGISEVEYFARGKRGIVYKGNLNGKTVTIKAKHPHSQAMGKTKQESDMLQRLNKHGIGPKYLFCGENYLVYEFVEGTMLPEFINENSKEKIAIVLDEVFNQLIELDNLGINKEEMHKPTKHVIVGKKTVMIDFERARFTQKPHNITQFVEYLISGNVYPILRNKGFVFEKEKLTGMAKEYRHGRATPEEIRDAIQ